MWLRTLLAIVATLAVATAGSVWAQTAERVDVALDAGHSRADVGAAGFGLREYEATLDLAWRVRAELEARGMTVRMTRTDDQPLTPLLRPADTEDIRLEQQARIAAGLPAWVFVSLHFNGGPVSLRGTETYFNPQRDDRAAVRDRALADMVQAAALASLDEIGYPITDRGAKSDLTAGKPYGHFFSLRGPIPSVLLELLFLSNPRDAAWAADPATLDTLAQGLARSIRGYLDAFPED
ncbi:MAG: N-acetylmuramoyl-L-alanine amidase [Chloroflexi bacterium]|nr:N-acetylmuramoyl-L-alanine amidase [Chloroflexota bacterium]